MSGSAWVLPVGIRRIQHDAAAADLERPRTLRLRRCFNLRKQRQAIIARKNLERYFEGPVRGIPIDLELGAIDIEASVTAIAIIDRAGIGDNAADQCLRHAIGTDLAAQACRKRHIRLQRAVTEPRSKQKIARRHLAGFERNAAIAIRRRPDRGGYSPRMLRVFRPYGDEHATTVRPFDA
jgi:hypothetical protein